MGRETFLFWGLDFETWIRILVFWFSSTLKEWAWIRENAKVRIQEAVLSLGLGYDFDVKDQDGVKSIFGHFEAQASLEM